MFDVFERAGLTKAFAVRCGVMAAASLACMTAFTVNAAHVTRMYDFEEGTAGNTTTTVADSVDSERFLDVPDVGLGDLDWIEVAGTTARPLPAGGLGDAVTSSVLTAPPLEAFTGNATFVDAQSFGTPAGGLANPSVGFDGFGSPAGAFSGEGVGNSSVALQFSGNSLFEDFNSGGGTRGVFFQADAATANDPVTNGTNTFESFSLLTQAWVYADPAAEGTEQVVYQIGTQHGTAVITADGFWAVENLPQAGVTNQPVRFGEWQHIAIFRGGGSSTFWVNGAVAQTGSGSFGSFANIITLGDQEFGGRPFTGLVDNFTVSGLGDLSLDASEDLEVFSLISPIGDPCDIDGNGACEQADYDIWNTNFGFDNTFGSGDPFTFAMGDADQNGRVDFFDFKIIADGVRAAGGSLTFSSIPEPTTLMSAVLASLAIAARRR